MNKKTQRWWDIPAAILLILALLSAAIRLNVTNWTDNLGQVEFVVLVAVILGLVLGKSAFNGKVAFLIGLGYSLFFVPWQLTELMPDGEWLVRLNVLYARLWYTTADVIRNQPVKDSILFVTAMYFLFWFAGLLAGYGLTRRANPWVPLLALGGMVLVIEYVVEMYHYVTVTGTIYSFFYLFFSLMLLGRVYFLRSRREWEQRGGTVELEVGYDLGRGVLVSALVLSLIAWNAPQLINVFQSNDPTRERISKGWQEIRDRVTKATNSLKSPSPMVVEGYGNNMFLGNGAALGTDVVFTVRPIGLAPTNRMYWTARSYDTYRNGQWVTSISNSQGIGPDSEALKYPTWTDRQQVTMGFSSRISLLQTLFFPGVPLKIDRNVSAILSKNPNGEVDLDALVMDPPLKAGEQYTVLASVANPNIKDMQNAGKDYPKWVTDRYLQLPDNFPQRIVQLAQEVAGDQKTPYDQANAITQYLRRTITYSDTIPSIPAGRDPIEYFLFDSRSGFCNYYATAEVLMLRSLGVPARLSAGYAEGDYDSKTNVYTVISKDSHAWPEVFFPTIGWVVFEPTVSQAALIYPSGTESSSNVDQSIVPNPVRPLPLQELNPADQYLKAHEHDTGAALNAQPAIQPWMIVALVFALLGLALVLLEMRRRRYTSLPLPAWFERTLDERGYRIPDWLHLWARQSLRTPMENLFWNVGVMLRIWGQAVGPSQTPAEQVELLVETIPALEQSAHTLLEEYQRAMYSRYPADLSKARRAVDDIRVTGLQNWVLRMVGLETSPSSAAS